MYRNSSNHLRTPRARRLTRPWITRLCRQKCIIFARGINSGIPHVRPRHTPERGKGCQGRQGSQPSELEIPAARLQQTREDGQADVTRMSPFSSP
eukprot:11753674-Alexandrium_andersonii.AAC.1